MSKKTNIGKKPIIKDFGIQPYRKCDKDYPEVIRTPTFKAANDATVVRESEYAKPYNESEDYSGMEYAAPNWPGTDWPGVDYPGMDLPVPDFPEMYDPWKMYFRCNVDPCWCGGDTKTFGAGCTYEIVRVKFFPPESDLSVTWTKNTISITALSGIRDNESGYLQITMLARVPKGGTLWQGKYDPVYGSHGGISVKECDDCCDDSEIAWDWDNSAETVAASSSCTIAITDSLGIGGPYSWSVVGTGFSLLSAQTTGLTNTLITDATACGSAIITVTGCDGTEVTGEVRCTAGFWDSQGAICYFVGELPDAPPVDGYMEKIRGAYKTGQTYQSCDTNKTCYGGGHPFNWTGCLDPLPLGKYCQQYYGAMPCTDCFIIEGGGPGQPTNDLCECFYEDPYCSVYYNTALESWKWECVP